MCRRPLAPFKLAISIKIVHLLLFVFLHFHLAHCGQPISIAIYQSEKASQDPVFAQYAFHPVVIVGQHAFHYGAGKSPTIVVDDVKRLEKHLNKSGFFKLLDPELLTAGHPYGDSENVETEKDYAGLLAVKKSLDHDFNKDNYDNFGNNCVHFAKKFIGHIVQPHIFHQILWPHQMNMADYAAGHASQGNFAFLQQNHAMAFPSYFHPAD